LEYSSNIDVMELIRKVETSWNAEHSFEWDEKQLLRILLNLNGVNNKYCGYV